MLATRLTGRRVSTIDGCLASPWPIADEYVTLAAKATRRQGLGTNLPRPLAATRTTTKPPQEKIVGGWVGGVGWRASRCSFLNFSPHIAACKANVWTPRICVCVVSRSVESDELSKFVVELLQLSARGHD